MIHRTRLQKLNYHGEWQIQTGQTDHTLCTCHFAKDKKYIKMNIKKKK